MSIIVTGATGQLGNQVIAHLLDRGVQPSEIIAIARNPEKAADYAARGIEVRYGDYDDAASLSTAFAGADKLLFISASSMDNTLRVRQHAAVVEAARNAGAAHIVYTGLAFAEQMKTGLENVHLATEYMLRTTGIPFTSLRNGFYLDMIANPGLKAIAASGHIINAAGNGQLNFVTRDNLALAAAVVLSEEGHANKLYNLVSPQPFTYEAIAQSLTTISGKAVSYQSVPAAEAVKHLVQSGIPEGFAGFLVHVLDAAIADGQFSYVSDDLIKLIGSAYTPVDTALRQALEG